MRDDLKKIVKNAKNSALHVDGYNQAIILGKDDTYSYTRDYKGCCPKWYGKIVGKVITKWNNGILKAEYIPELHSTNC